jgi:hypothetical protein
MHIRLVALAALLVAFPVTAQDMPAMENLAAALQLYREPPTNREAVIEALTSDVGEWLRAGGDPAGLSSVLNAAADTTTTSFNVTLVDLDDDGSDEILIDTPTRGIPVLLFEADGNGCLLPPHENAIGWFRTASDADDVPVISIEDFTGDDAAEILINYIFPGAGNPVVSPVVYRRQAERCDLIFAASLMNGATLIRPEGEPTQIVLSYPYLYRYGFDHQQITHPLGQQTWRWNAASSRYEQVDARIEYVSANTDTPATTEDLLRWEVNEGETAFRLADYKTALLRYNNALALAAVERWTPVDRQPDWRGVAAFRRAQTLLLLRRADASPPANYAADGLIAMQTVQSSYQGDKLGELASVFLESYGDGTVPDSFTRAVAAIQRVDLYTYFYSDSTSGALRFPVDAGLLYPVAGVTAYLNRHPELAADPQQLRTELAALGYPISALTRVGDGLQIQFDPELLPTAAVPWRLQQGEEGWFAQPRTGALPSIWAEVGSF